MGRLARLGEDHPEVAELDLNPVLGLATGYVVVDARVRVCRPASPVDPEDLVTARSSCGFSAGGFSVSTDCAMAVWRDDSGVPQGGDMQTIVVGYDGSEPADRALDRATELIDDGGTVVLVSAIHMLAGKGGMGFDPIEKETSTGSSTRPRLVWPRRDRGHDRRGHGRSRPGHHRAGQGGRRRPDRGRKRAQEPPRASAVRLRQRRRLAPHELRRVGRRLMNTTVRLPRHTAPDAERAVFTACSAESTILPESLEAVRQADALQGERGS